MKEAQSKEIQEVLDKLRPAVRGLVTGTDHTLTVTTGPDGYVTQRIDTENGNVIINGVVMYGKLPDGATIDDRMPHYRGAKRMNFIKRHCALGRRNLRMFSRAMKKILRRHAVNNRNTDEAVERYFNKMFKKGLIPEMRGLMCTVEGEEAPSGMADEQELL